MISAIVHTFNEEKNISRCLTSLDFVQEIVVIDMGSSDKTLTIAKEFPVSVFSHPYTGFVESARNFGISKAKGDWLLIVDADEVVPRTLGDKLRQLSGDKQQQVKFYRLPRKNIILGKWIKHSGWWPDHQIRFFKKGSVIWSGEIHGVPITRGEGRELAAQEDLSLIHYHYDSLEQYLERLNRYTTIQAKELFLKNKKAELSMMFSYPVNEFVKRFFLLEGYRDGFHGLSLALLQSFSELVVILKLWELSGFRQEHISLSEYKRLSDNADKIKKYWLANELLKKPRHFISSLYLKILRSLNS
ncbi:hypothetical protein A3D78_05545 [Candidatus Gottesmanbacteria bacterium RIFCSPHIGHO2_02_FULL_39_14]|uniref:Glycosyltransferase 2-like domain-containing protein n=2 Tax=Candidatus Gottesmaniibacteriota TaxID=1752720 RepID=A0A1F5ZXW6_9BACT|nr:MAG: hypothetical protein A2153_01845 [Candidatus Gottesmanbacteria bacterium RBG_16_38_7b]OGG17290.1 MAG: hypothetical protein A3D78_05545 [Candidatus Gottesmanbacteria bacterium RIFCSPHIGHO2_02_FULL_39_14]